MNTLAHVSCLSCQEMSAFEKEQMITFPEKKRESLHLATSQAAKDLLKEHAWSHTLIFTGPGGNGADGWGIACLLKEASWDPIVIYTEPKGDLCKEMSFQAIQNGVQHIPLTDFLSSSLKNQKWDLIIDGFLGIQARGDLPSEMTLAICWANEQEAYKIALDCPTGWHQLEKTVFKAALTYCFHTVKRELLQKELRECCGSFKLIDVGFCDPHQGPQIFTGNPLKLLPEPQATWHKYKRGSLYLGVGSESYIGSAQLAEHCAWQSLDSFGPLAGMVYTLSAPLHPQSVHWQLEPVKASPNALVLGSGMEAKDKRLVDIFKLIPTFEHIVLDAGALDYLRENNHLWDTLPKNRVVLTPHEGEARRLLQLPKESSFDKMLERAQEMAQSKQIWVLLKSYVSYLFGPNGEQWMEPFAGPSLAVAGSGDKLAALIAAASLHLPLDQAILFACRWQAFECSSSISKF